MNTIFVHLIMKGQVAVYLDNILIYSIDLEEHCQIVNEVLARLAAHDVYLKPEECEFEKHSIEYLRLVLGNGHLQMDPV